MKQKVRLYVKIPADIKKALDRVIEAAGGAIEKTADTTGKVVMVTLKDGTTFVVRIVSGTGKMLSTLVFEIVPEKVFDLEQWLHKAGMKIMAKR